TKWIVRLAEPFAGDVPHSLFNAGQGAGQHRAAAIELAAKDGLPVMFDFARVLADQIAPDFMHRCGNGLRTAFDHRLTEANDAFVSVHFQKQPARSDKYGFETGDFHESAFLTDTGTRDSLRGMNTMPLQTTICGGLGICYAISSRFSGMFSSRVSQ